jgi:hypothetical protein
MEKIIKYFRLIFRKNGNLGVNRITETPKQETILSNLETFVNIWNVAVSPLNKRETIAEIENLKKTHTIKGCISGIPPSFDT